MMCFHPLKCVVIVPKMKKFGGSFGNSIYEIAGVFNGFILKETIPSNSSAQDFALAAK